MFSFLYQYQYIYIYIIHINTFRTWVYLFIFRYMIYVETIICFSHIHVSIHIHIYDVYINTFIHIYIAIHSYTLSTSMFFNLLIYWLYYKVRTHLLTRLFFPGRGVPSLGLLEPGISSRRGTRLEGLQLHAAGAGCHGAVVAMCLGAAETKAPARKLGKPIYWNRCKLLNICCFLNFSYSVEGLLQTCMWRFPEIRDPKE